MNRYLFYYPLIVLLLTQCTLFSSKDDDKTDVNIDDFPLEELDNGEIIGMLIEYYADDNEDGSYVNIYVPHTLAPESAEVSLSINGTRVALDSESWDGQSEYYWWSEDEIYYPDQEVTYALQIGQTSYSGALQMPSSMAVSYPQEFDPQSDFPISWSIDSDPHLYHMYLGIEYRPSSSYEYHEDWFLVEGSRRNYTITPDQYPEISVEELKYVYTAVATINFNRDDDFVALTLNFSHDYFTQSFSMDYSKGIPGKRSRPGILHRR